MTPSEVARVLAKCAAYDRRTIGEADVAAWHEALGDLELAPCLAAVATHYRDTTTWAMPAHIRAIVKPNRPPYLRPLPALDAPPRNPEVGRRGIAACREALRRTR